MSGKPAGRPKGSLNKITKTIRESFSYVLGKIGSETWLKQFVDDHPVEFFGALSKMLPREFNIAVQVSCGLTGKDIDEVKQKACQALGFSGCEAQRVP